MARSLTPLPYTTGSVRSLESEDRRNPYQLTGAGEKALRARLQSMQAVARVGQKRLATA